MSDATRLKILFVDDDLYFSSYYVSMLEAHNCFVINVHTPDDALSAADQASKPFDAIVVDVMMPYGDFFDEIETAGGHKTGVALAQELSERQPKAVIVALTNSRAADVEAWFTARGSSHYFYKGDVTAEEFPTLLRNKVLGVTEPPRSLIVDGLDSASALALKHFLQNGLGLPEPSLMSEQPSLGMNFIQKFEYYAQGARLFFILIAPEDLPQGGAVLQDAAAQYAYLLGMLKGRDGRAFMLYKRGVSLPQFFQGVVAIDITGGVESAAEHIRRELRGLLRV